MNLGQVLQTFRRGDGTGDVTYFNDGLVGCDMRPESGVSDDDKLVVSAQTDAVHVRVRNHVRMKVRAAKKTSTSRGSVHLTILHATQPSRTS